MKERQYKNINNQEVCAMHSAFKGKAEKNGIKCGGIKNRRMLK